LNIIDLGLSGVKLLEPKVFGDFRGWYSETYSTRTMQQFGLDMIFVQDNHAYTIKKGTIRGIHFQNNPLAQTKLIRCTSGNVLDIVVDLRKGSPTYKQWLKVLLEAGKHQQLLIPAGFGHGYLTLTDNTEILYKVDALYSPELDRAIAWNDPDIAIDWGIEDPILSEKDRNASFLKNSDVNFIF